MILPLLLTVVQLCVPSLAVMWTGLAANFIVLINLADANLRLAHKWYLIIFQSFHANMFLLPRITFPIAHVEECVSLSWSYSIKKLPTGLSQLYFKSCLKQAGLSLSGHGLGLQDLWPWLQYWPSSHTFQTFACIDIKNNCSINVQGDLGTILLWISNICHMGTKPVP